MKSNDKIMDLYTDKLIMGEIKFKDISGALKEELEKHLIDLGLGYLTLDEER